MPRMTWETFKSDLKEIGYMQKELKRRGMVFQRELKEDRAKALGLPLWAFYSLGYEDLTHDKYGNDAWARTWFEERRKSLEREEREDFMRTHGGPDWREKLTAELSNRLQQDITPEVRAEVQVMLDEIKEDTDG